MSLRAFNEAALTNLFTLTDDFNYPDPGEADGDGGETITNLLYIAVMQRKLSGGIDNSQEDVELDYAWPANDGKNIVQFVSGEKGLVTAGWGTTSLTVTRGYHGTAKSSQADDSTFQKCYYALANEATVLAIDNEGSDQSGWVTYCLAPGGVPDESYSATLYLSPAAVIEPGDVIIVQRKIVVPASWDPEDKQDLLHRISATLKEFTAA